MKPESRNLKSVLLVVVLALAVLMAGCALLPAAPEEDIPPDDLPEPGEPLDAPVYTPTATFQVPSSMLTLIPTWNVKPGTPTGTPPSSQPTPAKPTPAPAPATPAPGWDGKSRVNILCLGLDDLNPKARYRRSDSIIVVSIDPATKSVGMLSIPRDLYVPITGLNPPQRNRINTAYVWGDYYRYPGGGPALAMRTVQETLGIPIHHYVAIDFVGFVKSIDALGGVDITLEKPLADPLTKWSFPAGKQHLNGQAALRFVRTRYMDSDFQRERRQQKLLLALRDQALRVDVLPKLPALLTSLWGSFKTDLSLAELLSLARLGTEIDAGRIHNHIIDETMVSSYRTPAGAAVLLPKEAAIRKLVQEVLAGSPPVAVVLTPTPAPTPTATPRPPSPTPTSTAIPVGVGEKERLQQEKARIEVLNGTNVRGLAARTRSALQEQGFQVTRIGDADRYTYAETILVVYIDKPFTRELLAKQLSIKPQNVRLTPNPKATVDLRVILGKDANKP